MRVGIISLVHESNTFAVTPTTIELFRRDSLLLGEAVRSEFEGGLHQLRGRRRAVRLRRSVSRGMARSGSYGLSQGYCVAQNDMPLRRVARTLQGISTGGREAVGSAPGTD